jgi:hypothetical protein
MLALLVIVPEAVAAQGIGFAARAGTLGIGVEGAVGLSDRLVVRGGIGLWSPEASTTFDQIDVDLSLPDSWYNVGLDVYMNGSIRIGGGLLFKSDNPTIRGTFNSPVDIGGLTFTPAEIGTLTGSIASKDTAPYVLIGFGKHTASGIGLSLDIGAAYLGDPQVSLASEGGTFPDQTELNSRLAQEALDFEDDMKAYLKIWPILNLGVRIGVG